MIVGIIVALTILAVWAARKALRARRPVAERKEPTLEPVASVQVAPALPAPAVSTGRRVTITLATARASSRLAWAAQCRSGSVPAMLTGTAWLGGGVVSDVAAVVVALRAAAAEQLVGPADVVTLRLPEAAAALLSGERPPKWQDEVAVAQEIAKLVVDGGFRLMIEQGGSRRCEQQAQATLNDQGCQDIRPIPLAATA